MPGQKQRAVAAFKLLNYHVIAAGDSFNDTAMLTEAHVGFLFRAPAFVRLRPGKPDNVKAKFPQLDAVESYAELMKLVKGAMAVRGRYSCSCC